MLAFNSIIVIISVPLMVKIVYPYCDNIYKGEKLIFARMFIGQVFTTFAMVNAGLVEHERFYSIWEECIANSTYNASCNGRVIEQTFGGVTHKAAVMSVFWLIPQYVLIGFGEVFTVIAGYEYALKIAPKSMLGIIVGLFYALQGIGYLLALGMFELAQNWLLFSNDPSGDDLINFRGTWSEDGKFHQSRLYLYYWMLGGIQFGGLIIFCSILCFSTFQNRERKLLTRVSPDSAKHPD